MGCKERVRGRGLGLYRSIASTSKNIPMGINVTHVFTTMAVCPPPNAVACIGGGSVLDADINRYAHAFTHGGIYRDDDVSMIVNPRGWHNRFPSLPWTLADLVVGVEFPQPMGTGPSGCCLQFVQWIFGARRSAKVLGAVVRAARLNVRANHDVASAVTLTGPILFTSIILKHIGSAFDLRAVEAGGAGYASVITGETIIVLPYRAFGIHPHHRGSHIKTTPADQQLARHHFKGRWRH